MNNDMNQNLYDESKKIVKIWECNFIKNRGRPPSKLDIREADKNVRHAYCMYFKLKTALLEQSLLDIFDDGDDPVITLNQELNQGEELQEETNILEENKTITEPQDEVWGEHLNKKADEEKVVNMIQSKTENSNTVLSQKLFKNSKFIKRNPRKSFQSNKSTSSLNLSQSLSQSISSTPSDETETNSTISDIPLSSFNSILPISSGTRQISSQSVDIISQLLDSKNTSIRHVDKGWLQRISINTGTKLSDSGNAPSSTELFEDYTKVVSNNRIELVEESVKITSNKIPESYDKSQSNDFDFDDIISDSDDEINSTLHLSKRIKLSFPVNNVALNISSNLSYLQSEQKLKINNASSAAKANIIICDNFTTNQSNNFKTDNTTIKIATDVIEENTKDINPQISDTNFNDEAEETFTKPIRRPRKIVSDSESDYEESQSIRKRKRNVKTPRNTKQTTKPNVKKTPRNTKQTTNTTPRITKKTAKENPRNTKQASRQNRSNSAKSKETSDPEKTTNITEEYEMEYSIKPPPSTVPRYNIKNILSDSQSQENVKEVIDRKITKASLQKEVAKNKLLQKIESGSLNENFVRIDIKKKVYVRGKKHMNFTKFKKQMWKNKKKALYGPDMDMGGCDGGQLTCFKCGKTGHFARQCKAESDKLLPLEAVDEEECLLPSLEEASKMASESVLAVRTPNQIISKPESCKSRFDSAEINNGLEQNVDEENKNLAYEFDEDDELESFILNANIESEIQNSQISSNELELSQKWVQLLEENDIKPVYELNPDGSLPDTPEEVFEALEKFGHTSFRPGQEQAVMRILCGQSTLVTLSTGSGKSLCYQLPAYLYAKRKHCITLVISPLVSLMEDQVAGFPAFLKAACLHTLQTATQKDKVLKLISSGELNVLLVSPEAVTAGEKKSGFGSLLRKLPPIAYACIDEAHCVSQWSHNFRPSYLVICRVLRERLGIQIVLGLTATSTHATSYSIVEHLQIPDGRNGVISDIPLPDNLYLSASRDMQRDAALRNLLSCDPFDDFDSIIIYCTRRDECERIASHLRAVMRIKPSETPLKKYKSISPVSEPYHAGLPASKRRTVQNAFMSGYLRIVVATVAFGMGINKANIRGVIHYNMPRNFESYVQEVGRAGRDGLPAHCHLFLDSEGKDQNELRRHIYTNSMDRHAIRKLLKKIFVPCDCKYICPRHEVAFSIENTVKELDVPEENISTLLCYLELHEKRYVQVLTPVYAQCKIIAYGGAQHIKKAAKDCPPLAMALALQKKGEQEMKENVFEFPVVDIASAIGWDSGIVKSKLKNLEWETDKNLPKRSSLTVEFSNLGFHLRAPGNLPPAELDEALDSLFAKKKEQEITSLQQLQVVHSTLTSVAEKYYHLCLTEQFAQKSTQLKNKIREYFSCEQPLKNIEYTSKEIANEQQITADVRSIVSMYRDNSFSGRAVARIFHGIQSPNYPAVIWGRCKFWRIHLNADFNKVCQICTAEILKLR